MYLGSYRFDDACPTRHEFAEFSESDDFRAAVRAAGLPEPRVEQLGEVHAAHLDPTRVR